MHGRELSSETTQVMETHGQKDRESVSSSSSTEVQIPKVVVINKNT